MCWQQGGLRRPWRPPGLLPLALLGQPNQGLGTRASHDHPSHCLVQLGPPVQEKQKAKKLQKAGSGDVATAGAAAGPAAAAGGSDGGQGGGSSEDEDGKVEQADLD